MVAGHLLQKIDFITDSRIEHANYLDKALQDIAEVTVPHREPKIKQVYHLYSVCCERRDELQQFLISNQIDAKIHYPRPMHLQPAAEYLEHKPGDFPVCERIAGTTLSLPVHEFITEDELAFIVNKIKEFYRR